MRRSTYTAVTCSVIFTCIAISLCSCALTPPKTFVRITESTGSSWKSIEVRKELTYEEAWQTLVDISSKWGVETMDKDAGYIRTAWVFSTGRDKGTGGPFTYGKRTTLKFSEDRKTLRIKTESYYSVPNFATEYGMDTAFDDDVLSEISGKLGLVAR